MDNAVIKATDRDISTIPYTSRIKNFHTDLSTVNWQLIPSCLFIRDYENLPTHAPNDIDLMASEDEFDKIIELFSIHAKNNELICLPKKSPGGLFILIFDLFYSENHRCWSYFEIRKNIILKQGDTITANDVTIIHENGLPIPDNQWRFLLLLHQGLRKAKLAKYNKTLNQMLKANKEVVALVKNRFDLTDNDIESILNNPSQSELWRQKIGITKGGAKKRPYQSSLSKIKQKLSYKFYPLHTKGPVLFTLHGPDGVGKTTITNEISDILSRYPFEHEVFHHITGWKKKKKNTKTSKDESSGTPVNSGKKISFFHQMLRIIYRYLPPLLRNVWLYSSNYTKYSSNLNRHILDNFYESKVMICDRYIYDLWAKEQISSNYSRFLHPLHYVYNRLLRLPKIAFVITDDPKEIYKRKQELTPLQIEKYQKIMGKIVKEVGVPTIEIAVSGRKPDEIAREIVMELLHVTNSIIFNVITDNKYKLSYGDK